MAFYIFVHSSVTEIRQKLLINMTMCNYHKQIWKKNLTFLSRLAHGF